MNIVLWIVQILLALLFMLGGVTKLMMSQASYAEMSAGAPVPLPYGFMVFIGVCEVLGAIGLIVPWLTGIKPRLTPLAAALLIVIMIGAVVTSIPMGIVMAIAPTVAGLLCAFVAWGRGRRTAAMP